MSIVPTGWMSERKPAIGMVHLLPLPGSPACRNSLEGITTAALRDAQSLVEGGMDGIMIENFGDTPFYPDQVPPVTVACMTAVAHDVRLRFDVPLGVNVLRNDALAALSVATAVGANFIRVNVLCGARLTDQGIINGPAHHLLRERARLSADDVQIWADVQVKHSAPIAVQPLADEVGDIIMRGQADGVIVSGSATGQEASPVEASEVKGLAGDVPVLVGSGVSAENVGDWLPVADGFIVGTALKIAQRVDQPVDEEAVKRFVEAMRSA